MYLTFYTKYFINIIIALFNIRPKRLSEAGVTTMSDDSNPIVAGSDDERLLLSLLKRLPPFLPLDVFHELSKRVMLTAVETVCLRTGENGIEVFLTRRSPDDEYYPNLWHSPGTMLRADDAPRQMNVAAGYESAFRRLEEKELHLKFVDTPRLVGSRLYSSPRGSENSMVFLAEIEGEPENGKFFPVDELPADLVESHRGIIAIAVRHYE